MTQPQTPTCPMPRGRAIDTYFMEHRAKLLDIAAFLDRLDRAAPGDSDGEDFRIKQLKEGVQILLDDKPARTQRILELMSDPTMQPLESAAGLKGAHGAYPGRK